MIEKPFSTRQGYKREDKQVTVREDAPEELRNAILMLAKKLEMSPHDMRDVICEVLLVAPDPDNWSPYPNVWFEVQNLMSDADWYRVYDIAEAFYKRFVSDNPEASVEFERRLNEFFHEKGIGWNLRNGQILFRGSETFVNSTHKAPQTLEKVGFQRAANEMREALKDISRRPNADITGAIQHAMAALESTAREVTGDRNSTLGKLAKHALPSPLDKAIEKLWGYASDHGRHIREDHTVDITEAELIVAIAGSLCEFFAQRKYEKSDNRSFNEKELNRSLPQTKRFIGKVHFNYSNYNGRYIIGSDKAKFETMWTKRNGSSIYLYSDPESIEWIAVTPREIQSISQVKNCKSLNYTSRSREVHINQIAVLKNVEGFYAAIRVLKIKHDTHGDENDEILFEYVIQKNGSDDFSLFNI